MSRERAREHVSPMRGRGAIYLVLILRYVPRQLFGVRHLPARKEPLRNLVWVVLPRRLATQKAGQSDLNLAIERRRPAGSDGS